MPNSELKVVLESDLVIEPIGDEVAVTLSNGDIVVLNVTAGWMLSRLSEPGISLGALVSEYVERFDVNRDHAVGDVASTVDEFANQGIARLCGPQEKPSRRQFISALPDYTADVLAAMRKTENALESRACSAKDVIVFRDALGNEIEIPGLVERIAPRGPFAQALAESVSPSLVAGVNARGLHASVAHLAKHPALRMGDPDMVGRFSRNVDSAVGADIILDAGSRLSRLYQASRPDTGIPVVRLIVPFGSLANAYAQLHRLTGLDKALELASLSEAVATLCQAGAGSPLRVFFVQGKEGLSTRGRGTLVDDMLVSMGMENVAHGLAPDDCRDLSCRDVTDMRPDVVVLLPPGRDDGELAWRLNEVTSCPVYVVPRTPFPWVDRSPLAMQTVGALWLARIARGGDAESDFDEAISACFEKFFGMNKSTLGGIKDLLKRKEPYGG